MVTALLVAAVILATLEIVPLIKVVGFLLLYMLASGFVSGSELRRRFPFELWLIIASALTLSQALTNAGMVELMAERLHNSLSAIGPYGALIGIYLGTLLLTEVMTNNAAAALSFPVAFGLAETYGVDYKPFVMVVA